MVNMKRTSFWSFSLLLLALSVSSAVAQSDAPLGDYARQARKQKAQAVPAGKKFDNDNLPREDKLSVVGQPPPETDAAATSGEPAPKSPDVTTTAQATGDAPAGSEAAPKADAKEAPAPDPQAEKQKVYQEWQKRIHTQQDQIDLLSRELDVLNREYRLRAAAFYADAGNRLRSSGAWDKEDSQYKDQVAAKQKTLDDAKKTLEDLQEQARKAGVPSSMRE
jgi:hypothetical protein